MGTTNSKIVQALSSNENLNRFIASQKIELDDPFWEEFLSFPVRSFSKDDDEFMFHKTRCYFYQLIVTNNQTGNINRLVKFFIQKVNNVIQAPSTEFEISLPVMQNALLVIRLFLQHLVHQFPECEIFSHFDIRDSIENPPGAEVLLAEFIETLYTVILQFPVLESSYGVLQECINNLLVLLSVELFMDESVKDLRVYKFIFGSASAVKIAERLTLRFIINLEDDSQEASTSTIFGISYIMRYFLSVKERPDEILSRSAVILLIVLVNQYTEGPNPFRETFGLLDHAFPSLYKKICSSLEKEEMTLLLYNLLHGNEKFKEFVIAQNDIDALVVPMLKAVYHANDNGCHHIYMSLIVLLILTEVTEFNKKVHTIVLKNIPWYVDKNVGEVTLGGLIILVTTRTVKINLLKMRDEYLHTNCLAALANMSSQFSDLSPYVCERLVGLFEKLAKTYKRAEQELVAIEKALRILLEVLNSCLCNQMANNTNLVYTLLYKRYIFEPFKENPAFQDIICNIQQVMEYFATRLDAQVKNNQGPVDVNSVYEIIQKYSSSWIISQLQKFPELKFKYVEEEKPEKFFTPYVWSLAHKSSCLFFEPDFQTLPPYKIDLMVLRALMIFYVKNEFDDTIE